MKISLGYSFVKLTLSNTSQPKRLKIFENLSDVKTSGYQFSIDVMKKSKDMNNSFGIIQVDRH